MQKPAGQLSTDTFGMVKFIIADTSGWEIEEITTDSRFDEDDLGISMSDEFPLIIAKLRKRFAEAGENIPLPIDKARRCETVGDLIELIEDERDL